MAGLPHDTINIPLATLNQSVPEHQGPLGRLLELKDAIATHYTGANPGQDTVNTGPRIKIKPRPAFLSLSTDGTSPVDGEAVDLSWASPELLSPLGRQLLSVAGSVPRVSPGNDKDWVGYVDKRLATNQLRSDVFHTSQNTLQAPSDAWIDGVTCSVWTETTNQSGESNTIAYIGFKADDGAWLVSPKVLHDPGMTIDDRIVLARVRSDGTRFWVAFNVVTDGDPFIQLYVYETSGARVADGLVPQLNTIPSVGYWDIAPLETDLLALVQPGDVPDGTTDVHAQITTCSRSGPGISTASTVDTNIHSSGPVAWLSSKLGAGFLYLGTHLNNDGLFGYQVDPDTRLETHEYLIGGAEDEPDTIIGWAEAGTDPDEPTLNVAFSNQVLSSPSSGPPNDPGLRSTEVWRCEWAGIGDKQRQNDSVIIVSRAFEHDGEWYALTYYQSGSGLAITQTSLEVDVIPGDYMIGQPVQALLPVSGDLVYGSPQNLDGNGITVTTAQASQNISAAGTPDQVVVVAASGIPGVRDGDSVLRWTFQNQSVGATSVGGRMVIAGATGRPTANGSWVVIGLASAGPTDSWYTRYTSTTGTQVIPGTFTTAGTVTIQSMTYYKISNLPDIYNRVTTLHPVGGTIVVTGNPTGANNGTFTIDAVEIDVNNGPNGGGSIGIVTTSQVGSPAGFAATITNTLNNNWFFRQGNFYDAMHNSGIDHFLNVGNDPFIVIPDGTTWNNTGQYLITDVTNTQLMEADGTGVKPQSVLVPFEASVSLGDPTQAMQFKFQNVTPDFTYVGATMSLRETGPAANTGTYTITQINDDDSFFAVPTNGLTDQVTESFDTAVLCTIFFSQNIRKVFQPCWFMTPLESDDEINQAHVGRFEYMSAFADWRFEGDADQPINMFLMSVTDPVETDDGIRFVLPYRAQSFTASQPLVVPAGTVVPASTTVAVSTVGLKTFDILDEPGLAGLQANELLIPGMQAARFTSSGFTEDGINVAPEAPYIVTQEVTTDPLHLTVKAKYDYMVVFEVTDENGNRIYSLPSPNLSVTMTGANNSATIGGRSIQPFDTSGILSDGFFGMTNHKLVGISIYRTSNRSGTPTINHFKITNDLAVNGLAPISTDNNSGFSFPDEFTWEYIDRNPDNQILVNEVLYTDKDFLPRFPAPAFSVSCNWKNRPWVIGYDNAVWVGGELTEGDSSWFFPGFRFLFPSRPTQIVPMDEFMIVFCSDRSIWYIPAPSSFPDAKGQNGSLPTPVRTTLTNGCTGLAIPIKNGIAYSSSAGGVWFLTRSLDNSWLSQPIIDDLNLASSEVLSMVVDEDQRLHVLARSLSEPISSWFVFDQVIGCWYRWTFTSTNIALLAVVDGAVHFQNSDLVARCTPGAYVDVLGETERAVAWDFTTAEFNFGNVRNLKRVWEFQVVGQYKGPHRLNVILSYPDQDEPDTTFEPYTPDPDVPYAFPFNPMVEESSSYQIRMFVDFTDVESPGASAEIELISADVGLDHKSGINKNNNRIRAGS